MAEPYRWKGKSYHAITIGDYEAMTADDQRLFNAEWRRRHDLAVEAWLDTGRHDDHDLLDSYTYGEHGL
jgi:hypothetical protein